MKIATVVARWLLATALYGDPRGVSPDIAGSDSGGRIAHPRYLTRNRSCPCLAVPPTTPFPTCSPPPPSSHHSWSYDRRARQGRVAAEARTCHQYIPCVFFLHTRNSGGSAILYGLISAYRRDRKSAV